MPPTDPHLEPDDSGTDAADAPDQLLGIQQNWNSEGDGWDGHDYASIPVPVERNRPKPQWEPEERRAWLLEQLQEYGTWRNVPASQAEVAADFDVSQQSISNDLKQLRKYIRYHAGNKAISMTEMVAQRAVAELQEDEDWFKALQAQLDYNEFLFEMGRLERAPDKKQVQSVNVDADASDLTGEEADHFADLADKLQRGQSAETEDDDVIDVDGGAADE